MQAATLGLLQRLTSTPTAPGREQIVIDVVSAWVRRRSGIQIEQDRHGNLLIRPDPPETGSVPMLAVAHLDHPGFVVARSAGRLVIAEFRGGVRAEYFPGAAVEFFDRSGRSHPGRVKSGIPGGPIEVELARAAELLAGDIGRWRFRESDLGLDGDRLRAPACDDLAGVAAALAAFDRTRRREATAHFGVLLTRAEEVGFVGAIAAAKSRLIPKRAKLLSIETSRAFPDSPIGAGPIVRVGDASSVFDSDLTNAVAETAVRSGITHQRKLMAGGSCEATAFGAYGYRATGLCLALGNYHNMGDLDRVEQGIGKARPAPEEISLADFDGLVELLVACARDLDGGADLSARLDRRFEASKHLLD